MTYTYLDAPRNTPLWAVAYHIDYNRTRYALRKKPVRGIIRMDDKFAIGMFCEYKKDSLELKKSGEVYASSREYADTYEEAVELYNHLIDSAITYLNTRIEEMEQDKIK